MFTKENNQQHEESLAEIIHNWDEENEDFLLEETAVADFKDTLNFKLPEVFTKPETFMPNRETRKHNIDSNFLTLTPIGYLLELMLTACYYSHEESHLQITC